MSWFVSPSLANKHYDKFIKAKIAELKLVDSEVNRYGLHINPLQELCRLILTNEPRMDTCKTVCQQNGDCPERSSNYCKIVTNRDSKYDRTDWRRQASFFYKAINKHKDNIEKIVGKSRINYFLAQIIDLGKQNLKQIKKSEREEFIQRNGNLPDIDLEPVTIQEMEADPWETFMKQENKPQEHLLC